MAAFIQAYQSGADGIECDIRLTLDEKPIVIHDAYLNRTTNGTGPVSQTRYKEIRKLDAGGWFHPAYVGEKVPSLSELLSWIKKTPLLLNIEIKPIQPQIGVIEKSVLTLLQKHDLLSRTVISSYDLTSLQILKQLNADVKTALIYLYLDEPWFYAEEVGATSLHPYYPLLTIDTYIELKRRGFEVVPYTVDSWTELNEVIRLEASGVITNLPLKAKKLLSLLDAPYG